MTVSKCYNWHDGNKNNLRTIEAQIVPKCKNHKPQPKFTGSLLKKACMDFSWTPFPHYGFSINFPLCIFSLPQIMIEGAYSLNLSQICRLFLSSNSKDRELTTCFCCPGPTHILLMGGGGGGAYEGFFGVWNFGQKEFLWVYERHWDFLGS